MRIYGPNGTALATAPAAARRTAGGSFSVSEQEAAAQFRGRRARCARFRRHRCADRAAGRRGSDRAHEARGRQRPQRARRARCAQARPARRQRSTARRWRGCKSAADGLTEELRRPRPRYGLGRDRPARGGRTGQGRRPLAPDTAVGALRPLQRMSLKYHNHSSAGREPYSDIVRAAGAPYISLPLAGGWTFAVKNKRRQGVQWDAGQDQDAIGRPTKSRS